MPGAFVVANAVEKRAGALSGRRNAGGFLIHFSAQFLVHFEPRLREVRARRTFVGRSGPNAPSPPIVWQARAAVRAYPAGSRPGASRTAASVTWWVAFRQLDWRNRPAAWLVPVMGYPASGILLPLAFARRRGSCEGEVKVGSPSPGSRPWQIVQPKLFDRVAGRWSSR